MLRAALNLTSDIVLFFRRDVLRFTDVNQAACAALGYSRRELLAMEVTEIVALEAREKLAIAIQQSEVEPATTVADLIALICRDGSEFPIEATVRQFQRNPRNLVVLVGRDATERKCLEHLFAFPTHLDPLTGLPNRTVLESRLKSATCRSATIGGRLALFLVDLNHFKQVNDQRGHLTGDAVLKVIAERLSKCVRAGDIVVRYGGDEFVIVADGLVDSREVAGLAERVVAAAGSPIALDDTEIRVSASVGIAIAHSGDKSKQGSGAVSLAAMLAQADRAMYRAKAAGRDGKYVIQENGRS